MNPDPETLAVYDAAAATYAERRRPVHPGRARAFATDIADGLRLDLGCGPGLWFAFLGRPLVGMDASATMLSAARGIDPSVPLVQGALEDLPFRDSTFTGVWANKCLQHAAADDMESVLAGLHRILRTHGRLAVELFAGSGTFRSDDDLPGRRFTLWNPDEFMGLLVATGFEVDHLDIVEPANNDDLGRILCSAVRG